LISNYEDLGIPSYSACFSPNCELLYVANGVNREIYQFDLLSNNIASTADVVGNTASTGFGGMQLGPDDRIYVARFVTSSYLGVIMSPNIKGANCTYVDDGVHLAGKSGKGGLPNYVNNVVGECLSYPVENVGNYAHFRVVMQDLGSSSFMLSWPGNERNTRYAVLHRKSNSGEWKQLMVDGSSRLLSNLDPATTYNVRVLPIDKRYQGYELLLNHFTDDVMGKNFNAGNAENEAIVTTMDKFDFNLYPNPARKSTTVKLDAGVVASSVDVYVMELSGKIIAQYNYDDVSGSREIPIPLNGLSNGIYHVAVQTDEAYKIEKLVVVR
jgi:hypothetical protein